MWTLRIRFILGWVLLVRPPPKPTPPWKPGGGGVFVWDIGIDLLGLLTSDYSIYDGTTIGTTVPGCQSFDQIEWTYNTGQLLSGSAFLYNFVPPHSPPNPLLTSPDQRQRNLERPSRRPHRRRPNKILRQRRNLGTRLRNKLQLRRRPILFQRVSSPIHGSNNPTCILHSHNY